MEDEVINLEDYDYCEESYFDFWAMPEYSDDDFIE